MKPTFDHSVNDLVNAYLKDELNHMSCRACAVANLMSARGVEFGRRADAWLKLISNTCRGDSWWMSDEERTEAIRQVNSTGYTIEELNRIEIAFEAHSFLMSNNENLTEDQRMLDGLMAVVSVLAEIHGVDLEAKEEAKKLFVKV
jgi:hypothetical protein